MTKKCKYCKTDMDAKASICPVCNKKQRNTKAMAIAVCSWLFIVVTIRYIINIGEADTHNTEAANESNTVTATSYKKPVVLSSVDPNDCKVIGSDNVNREYVEVATVGVVEHTIAVEPTVEPTVEPKPELTEDEYKALCTTYKYKDVLRNPENFVGQKVKVEVRISSVHEASMFNHTKYYFAHSKSSYGWYGDRYGIMDKRVDNSLKILTDDIIYVYGEITNPEYTKSIFLNSEEIFVIDMKYAELISE